ncbi:glycosyltransferase family 2 protein [Arhodomonas sp. SL1]|uniref:glycosyltransferase family 2 protein n=1 Tax=Arhodomonas sp. SL1 TaxID=3425691 RepID=UPI003F880524
MVLSVVIPVLDEAPNIPGLARELGHALADIEAYEIVFVDDGSSDDTQEVLAVLSAADPRIRLITHPANRGQSAALTSGVRAARGEWVVSLDGDGQNDPADIPRLLVEQQRSGAHLVTGWRRRRRDRWHRRWSSRVANTVRGRLLGDDCPDTGCGLKLFRRADFLDLPRFDHMHRFLPALFRRAGLPVASVAVSHRARAAGHSKYGLFDRLWVGVVDLLGVSWLGRRWIPTDYREVRP